MIVNVFVGPGQLVAPYVNVGVITIVPVIGAVPVFVPVNEIFPVPFAPSPIVVLLFVQEYVVVPTVFIVVKETAPELVLHITRFKG